MKCSNISRIRIIFYAMLLILFSIGISGCSGDTQQTAGYSSGDGGDSGWIRKSAKALENDKQITTNPDDQAQPSTAYDTANNRYLVVWTDYRDVNSSCGGPLCGTDIYGAICTGSGTGTGTTMTCGAEFVISNAAGNQSQPKVAFDIENQKYLVIWTDSRNSGYSQIYGQYVNAAGTLNGANTPLTPHEDPALLNPYDTAGVGLTLHYTSQSEPAIIYNATLRSFILIWRDVSNSDSANSISITPAGCNNPAIITYIPIPYGVDYSLIRTGEINGANPLTNASNIQDYSSLVFTDGFTDTGSAITAAFNTQVDETHPAPFYDKTNGNYFAIWQGRTYDVKFNMPYDTKDLTGTETQYVSPPGGTWDAGESFTVTSGSPITKIEVFLPNGDSVTGTTTTGIGTTSVTTTLQSASNAVGTTGQLRVVKTLDLGKTCIYKTGTWTPPTDSDDGLQKIKVRRWEVMGASRLARDLSYPCGANNSYNPSVSTDPNTKRALLAWEEQGTADKQIYGRLIDLTNFSNYSAQINVSTAQGDQTLPQVSYDNVNQRFMVVWEDARNQSINISNMDIYGQFIDPQGNLSGSNLPITVASGNQMEPALVFGDVDFRKFFIVWKDGRAPDNLDIYGQLWEFSVAPALLITAENDNPIYNQAIDFGNVDVGSSATKRFRLWNNGNAILTVHNITDPYEPFTLPTAKPTTIAPGVYYEMEVKFAPTAAGTYAGSPSNNYKIDVSSDGGSVALYLSGSSSNIEPLSITTASLPDAGIGTAYSQTLKAYGGTIPYTWSVPPGSLPPGLSLNSGTGVISGTPITAGSYTFTAQVADKNGITATRSLTIRVSVVNITTTGLKPWTLNISGYSETLSAAGGTAPYTWSKSSGNLPSGLTLAPTGIISGTPSSAGSYTFTAKVVDAASSEATKEFTIVINPSPVVLTTSLPSTVIGSSYSEAITVAGGTSPLTWSSISGSLPPGILLNTGSGQLTGTPTAAGTYTFTVQVTDAPGASATKGFTLIVANPLSITTSTLSDGTSGGTYTTTLTADGGKIPYTWSVTGSLPTGLTLASATGIISGTPSATGTFSFTVQVTDADGRTAAKTLSITIYNPLSISTTGLKPWTKDRAGYSETLSATGGKTPYTWSVSSGSLPNGLSLNAATGVISGTPTIANSYTFTIMATDANGATNTKDFTIVINPVLSITTASLANGTVGAGYSQQVAYSGGTSPYTWSVSVGTLPLGLTLDTATGLISGTPTTAATSTFTVKVTDASGASTTKSYSIIIYAAPNISVTPAAYAFGSVGIGIVKDITVTVSNTGGSPLVISSLCVEVGTGFSLVGSPSIPHTISAGSSTIFAVRFAPSLRGAYSGKLTIISNDPDSGTLTYALTGNGVNPPDIDVTPGSVDFGTLLAGAAKRVTLTIKNAAATGDGDLVINEFALEGIGFSFVTPPAYPQTLAPGASTTVTIEFMSPSSGNFTGSLKINSNDPDEAAVTVSLKAAVQPPPDITVTPVALSFGNVSIGQAKDLILSINNPGESDLSITNITVSGTGFSFAAAPSLPLTIAKGGSSSVTVRFTPAAVQSYSGSLTITSNDPDSPTLQVNLTGAGVNQPEIDVSPASLDFGSVQIDTTSDKKITIRNTGTTNLNITVSISGSAFALPASPPTRVAPGVSVDITVRFSPVAEVKYTGNLRIQSNDPDEPDTNISLNGTGVTQPTGGGGGGGSVSSSGGGCSIGGHQNVPSAFADMAVMLMPLFVIIMLRIRRKKK